MRIEIARNAKIAKDRRNWKGKTLPLINADDADQNDGRKTYRGFARIYADQEIARNAKIAKDRRK